MHCIVVTKTLYLKIKPLLNMLQQERERLVCSYGTFRISCR